MFKWLLQRGWHKRMAKNNQKSIRFSDEVAKIVEKVSGNGFNEKFENLCLDFDRTIPVRKKQLVNLESQIKEAVKRLNDTRLQINDMNNVVYDLKALAECKKNLERYCNSN